MRYIQVLAFLDPELLTGDLYNCKHDMPKFRSAKVGLNSLLTKNWGKKSYQLQP
jgi:hypothetical protein